ncbi:MAG: hypothetical protein PHR53_07045 [Bacteroidales bacterium]|nr:hypothetical protein [Bacteroidales bacterium]
MKVKSLLNVAIAILCVSMIAMVGCKKNDENNDNSTPESYPPISKIEVIVWGTSVELSWEKESGSNPVSYTILRDDVVIKTTTETSYRDVDMAVGDYHYCVTANYLTGSSVSQCIDATVETPAEEDYAKIIAGDYLGTISFLTETNENVTIALSYVGYNFVSFALDNVITYQGLSIPLNLNKEVGVALLEDGKYGFNFDDSVEVPMMETFPINVIGVVENDVLTVNVNVNNIPLIGVLQVLYVGNKQ